MPKTFPPLICASLIALAVNGVARVRVGLKLGYIDKTGKYIWEPGN
jgi:hypothetical protein